MFLFAIRHIPTRGFLPLVKHGMSRIEPSRTEMPRLFRSEQYAQQTLRAYLRGKWEKNWEFSVTIGEVRDKGSRPIKGTTRNPDDFEVILMSLVEVKP